MFQQFPVRMFAAVATAAAVFAGGLISGGAAMTEAAAPTATAPGTATPKEAGTPAGEAKPADPKSTAPAKPADPKAGTTAKSAAKPATPRPAPKFAAGVKVMNLWADKAPGQNGDTDWDIPAIGIYPAPEDKATGAAVVVCPGGGYGHLAMDHEGDQVAKWLNGLGVHAFVLKYRLAPRYKHPSPMLDVQRAIRTVRAKAAEWKVDPGRVGVLGFSAGGHLASTAATHFDAGDAKAADAVDRESCRPDFAVLGYPVITLVPPHAHMGSARNLLGANPDKDLLASLCNERMVTDKTPPTFLFHSTDDKAVVVQNSEMYVEAAKKAGVPVELAVYKQGGHGYGLGRKGQDNEAWPAACAAWLKSRGVLDKK